MDLNPDEVRIKREMADACERVIAIFDRTKWHRSALLSFVPADSVDAIVTDERRSGGPGARVARARRRSDHRRRSDDGPDVATVRPIDLSSAHPP